MKKFLSMLLTLVLTAALFAVPAMAEGKTVIAAIEGDPQQMDPTLNSYSRSSKVLQNLFKGLYKLDADGATYVPAMAESCEVSEDGLTYTFTLRDGLKWSDGSDLTAYDFEYSWLRVLNPEIGSKCVSDLWLIENAQAYYNGECAVEDVGIKAEDEKTFVVRLNAPTPWFLSLIATSSFLPVSKANVEANPNWTSDVATYVSNGPFMLKEYSSLNRLVLVKNPYYYMADDVKIDEVDFVIIEDATTELTAYNNGEINIGFLSNTISSDGLIQYKDSDEFHEQGKIGIQYCDFNTQLPEFSDSRVRRAFAMAIDRQAMLDALGVMRVSPSEPVPIRGCPTAQVLRRDALTGASLRVRRSGDRMRPMGGGDRLLSDVLTDRKIDRPLRDFVPLVVRENRVLWAVGVGIAEEAKLRPGDAAVKLEWFPD